MLTGSAYAQDPSTATLHVFVVDAQPPGVDVAIEVRPIDGGPPAQTASAAVDRPAVLRALGPGRYRVAATRAGVTASIEVALAPGEIVSMRAVPDGPDFSLATTERSHAGQAVVLGDTRMGRMPQSGQLWPLIDAFVVWSLVDVTDNGGVGTGRAGLFAGRDGSWTWNSFTMDGLDVTDPERTGVPLQYPDVKAFEAVSITSGLAPAEMATPAANVALAPRRPGATFHGSVEAAGTSGSMVSSSNHEFAPPISALGTWRDINAQFGGPLTSRLGLFVAARATGAETFDRGSTIARSTTLGSIFGHAVSRLNDREELRLVASGQAVTRPLEGGDLFLGRSTDQRDRFWHAQGTWTRVGDGGAVTTIGAGVQRGSRTPDVEAGVPGGTIDRVFDGPVPAPAARVATTRVDARAALNLPIRFAGRVSHASRVSAAIGRARSTSEILAMPRVAEMAGRVPARVWEFDAPSSAASARRMTELSLTAAHEIRVGDRWTIDAGLRLELWRGSADDAERGLSFTTLVPRLAVRRHFSALGLTAFGAIGRYHPRPPLSWLAFGDPAAPTARLYRWTDPNGNGLFDAGERGAQVALAGFGAPVGSIDPDLQLPSTAEYVVGAEYRVGTAEFRLTATIRHEHSIARALPVGIPLSSYTQSFIPDQTDDKLLLPVYDRPAGMAGSDRYLLTNGPDEHFIYHSLDATYEQPISSRFRVRASAIEWWARGPLGAPGFHVFEADQGLVGELFQDPNTLSHIYGSTFFDRSYVLKVSGTYQAPADIWTSFTANYRDGQAFAGFIVVPDLTQGPYPIQSYQRGRTRFTFTTLVDARVEKRFKVAGGRDAAIWLDVFNVPNMHLEVEEDPMPGLGFRRTTAVQPPRVFRLGARFDF